MLLRVTCSGTPYEIGQQHGSQAAEKVHGSIAFYQQFFQDTAKLSWDAVCIEAQKWLPFLEKNYSQYVEEMQGTPLSEQHTTDKPGLADAVNLPLEHILALNVRTEVAYGLMADGCTALSMHTTGAPGLLAQNWDWKTAQGPNIINLTIRGADAPTLCMMTEAGIIGKIGFSSAGVGVTLNAIAALGVAHDRLPVHLAMRAVLDWSSGGGARFVVDKLKGVGVAAAGHLLVADKNEAIGLEVSYRDLVEVRTTAVPCGKAVLHSNHYVEAHPGVKLGAVQLLDSPQRLDRIGELATSATQPITAATIQEWLCDKQGGPCGICRDDKATLGSTLFSIIMDLGVPCASVKMGKPDEDGEKVELTV